MNRRNFLTASSVAAVVAGFSEANARPKRKRHRRRNNSLPTTVVTPSAIDLQQLLRSFSNEEIRAELNRRLLSMYPVEKLQAEAERRGIQ